MKKFGDQWFTGTVDKVDYQNDHNDRIRGTLYHVKYTVSTA